MEQYGICPHCVAIAATTLFSSYMFIKQVDVKAKIVSLKNWKKK